MPPISAHSSRPWNCAMSFSSAGRSAPRKRGAMSAVPYIRERWPRSQIAVLGGHMMFWQHPEAFNHLLDEFVTALSAAPSAV